MYRNEIAKDNVVVVGIQGTGEASYNAHVNTKDTEVEFLISNAKLVHYSPHGHLA